jgi:hypothetical protein
VPGDVVAAQDDRGGDRGQGVHPLRLDHGARGEGLGEFCEHERARVVQADAGGPRGQEAQERAGALHGFFFGWFFFGWDPVWLGRMGTLMRFKTHLLNPRRRGLIGPVGAVERAGLRGGVGGLLVVHTAGRGGGGGGGAAPLGGADHLLCGRPLHHLVVAALVLVPV